MKRITAEITQKKSATKVTEVEIAQIEKTLAKDKAQAQTRSGAVEREISRAEESGRQMAEAKEELTRIEERLARKDFAAVQQQTINQIDAVHQNPTAVGNKPTGQHFQKSGFTGPVVPDDGDQFPFFHFKIDG